MEEEFSARSHPEDLAPALGPFSDAIVAIGLEAGPMSAFLVEGHKRSGLDSILMETRRRVHAAFSVIPVKTDRHDARGIAELLRMGWFQPVHLKKLLSYSTEAGHALAIKVDQSDRAAQYERQCRFR